MARIASRRVRRSSSENRAFLTARSSTTDSMTRSQSARSSSSPVARTRERISAASVLGALLALDLAGERLLEHREHAVGRRLTSGSGRPRRSPTAAATSAMPTPMIPDPTTPTRSITSLIVPAGNPWGEWRSLAMTHRARRREPRRQRPDRYEMTRRLEVAVATSWPRPSTHARLGERDPAPDLARDARRAQRAALERDGPQVAHVEVDRRVRRAGGGASCAPRSRRRCRRACRRARRARRRAGCTWTRRARTRTRCGRPRARRCGIRTRRPWVAARRRRRGWR